MPWTGIGAGLVTGSAGIFGDLLSFLGGHNLNTVQRHMSDHANRIMIDLANSAHQREVKDLRKAGLNPILSAGGSGAMTPSLNVPTLDNELESFSDLGDQTAQALNTASTVAQGISNVELTGQKIDSEKFSQSLMHSQALKNYEESEALRLSNASSALDLDIKTGLYDDFERGGIKLGDDGILEITKGGTDGKIASEYIKNKIWNWKKGYHDFRSASSSADISERSFLSMQDPDDKRFNDTWIPRINTASQVVRDGLDAAFGFNVMNMLKKGKIKPSKKGWKNK